MAHDEVIPAAGIAEVLKPGDSAATVLSRASTQGVFVLVLNPSALRLLVIALSVASESYPEDAESLSELARDFAALHEVQRARLN